MAVRSVSGTPEQWQRVADQVFRRRVHKLRLTHPQVVSRAGKGLSTNVLSQMENARNTSYSPNTLIALCAALGWTTDSIDRILAGQDPIPVEPAKHQDGLEATPPSQGTATITALPDAADRQQASPAQRVAELDAELAEVRAESRAELAGLRSELRAERRERLRLEARLVGCTDELSDDEVDVVAAWTITQREAWWTGHTREQRIEHLTILRQRQAAATGTC